MDRKSLRRWPLGSQKWEWEVNVKITLIHNTLEHLSVGDKWQPIDVRCYL